jgi:serine/threonine protein kinase
MDRAEYDLVEHPVAAIEGGASSDGGGRPLQEPPTGLQAGARLGPYEIVASLGKGAMGEVYRARDTRLGREVAIKVLPSALSADPDRPTELVEGKTLREVLASGRLPAKTLLSMATQLAAGLSKAHAAGIVRRDLKPENVMVAIRTWQAFGATPPSSRSCRS